MYPYLMDSDHISLISRGGELSERIIPYTVSRRRLELGWELIR